jgi:hypothetical protein
MHVDDKRKLNVRYLRSSMDNPRLSNLLLLYKSHDIVSNLDAKELMVKWHHSRRNKSRMLASNLVASSSIGVCTPMAGSKWHSSNLSSSYTVVCNKPHRGRRIIVRSCSIS